MGLKRIDLVLNEDARGCGFEIQGLQKSKAFQNQSIKDVVIQSINPSKERGGHYHKRKTEWFMPLSGKAILVWTNNLNPKKTDLKIETLEADSKKPYVLEAPPMVAHWIRNNSDEVFTMAVFNTEEYTQQNPDAYKIETCNE